jgi:hypothetical protein
MRKCCTAPSIRLSPLAPPTACGCRRARTVTTKVSAPRRTTCEKSKSGERFHLRV